MNTFKNIAMLLVLSFVAVFSTGCDQVSNATDSYPGEPGCEEVVMAYAEEMLPVIIDHVNTAMVEAIDFDREDIEAYVPLKQGDVVVKRLTAENLANDQEMPDSVYRKLKDFAVGYRCGNTVYLCPESHLDATWPSGINEAYLYDTICHEVLHVAVMRAPRFYSCRASDGTVEDDIREKVETSRMRIMHSLNEAIVHTLAAEMTAEFYGLEEPVYIWSSVTPLGPFYVDGTAYELPVENVVKGVHANFTGSYKFATCKKSADLLIEELWSSITQSVR